MADVLNGESNTRLTCPECNHAVPMRFLFPAKRADPCEELNAWRFQRCIYCGWCGDAVTKTPYAFMVIPDYGCFVDGHYYASLRDFLTAVNLC